MFRKLKWQFILTNLAIISALFFSLTVGAYLLLQTNMVNHAKLFTQRLATAINSGEFQSFPSKTPPMPHDFPRNNSLLPHDGPGPMLHDIPKNKAPMPNQLQIQHGEGFAIVLRNKAPEHNDNSIPPFFPRVDGHTPNEIQLPPVFFIKTASNGVINFQSDKLSFSAGQLTSLASQILHRNPAKVDDGVITFLQTQYFFFQNPVLGSTGDADGISRFAS